MEPSNQEPVSRQDFIKQGLARILGHVASALPDNPLPRLAELKPLVRPPGAVEGFYKLCDPYCQQCVTACPREAIIKDELGFPHIVAGQAPCVMCHDVACTKVCPTGALTLLDDPRAIRMGLARIEVTTCTAYQGSGCQTCYDTCPILGEAIVIKEGLPVVINEACTGCGVCVHHCPTPGAIAIEPVATISPM